MTDNSNNSGWITTSGQTADNGSNLLNNETRREPQAVVGKGGLEINGTGPVKSDGPASYSMGQEAPIDGSIMATVKASHGGAIGDRDPNGNDIVTIGGMKTSIAAAVNAKFLVRNHNGSYSDPVKPAELKDPTAGAAKEPAGKPESEAEGDGFGLPLEAQKALGAISTSVMPGDSIKAMDSIIVNGEVDANTLARMASQAGVEPDDMAAQVATAENGFREVLTGVVEDGGIDTEAFGAFLEADPARGNKMMQAARAAVMSNDVSGLEELTETFYEHADSFMPEETRAALTEAGFDYQEGVNGLQVLISGTLVSFNVAVKQQIIKFL